MRKSVCGLALLGLLGLGAFVPACGGDNKNVTYPKADAGAGQAVVNDQGGQVGVTDGSGDHADSTLSGPAREPYDKGWRLWLDGDLQGAKAAFQQAISADSKAPAPHYSLACVLDRLGDSSGAQQEYRTAFTQKPDYELAMGAYAISLANAGHAGEADTFLADKHAKTPSSARITTYLAEVKSIEKDSGSAQQLAQDALRLDPDYKDAMVTIARDHWRARRLELAKYALQAILTGFGDSSPPRDKDNAEAHLLQGLIEKEAGQRAPAFADFDAAVRKRPDMVEALIQLGVMKLEAGNSQDATPLLESATRFAPKSALAHLNLGDSYRLAGRAADAKREFDTALGMDSSLAVAHYDLGLLYLFSPSIPGTNASDQVSTAIRELDTFKTMRGARALNQADDVDELLARAKSKQAELKQGAAAAAAPAASPSATAPAGSAAGSATAAKPDAGK